MAAETPMAMAPRTIMSLDDGGDLLVVGGEDVGFFVRELGLIEEVDAFGEPFEGGNHVALVYRETEELVSKSRSAESAPKSFVGGHER